MNRVITVKGTGRVSSKPDLVVLSMALESQKLKYDETMELATESLQELTAAIQSCGFKKEDLKTTNFNIRTHYENYKDADNNYKNKFAGYICEQGLKLEFDLDTKMLSKVLGVISETSVNPILSINFSIKDSNAVGIELLERATVNARQKAEILAKASGVTLGKILTIDYNWSELLFSSVTRFELQNQAMTSASRFVPDIEPEDIESSDTVTFVWEII